MNDILKRGVAAVLMVGVSLAATMTWGVPKIAYEKAQNSEIILSVDGSEVTREEFSYFLNAMYENLQAQGVSDTLIQDEYTGPAFIDYVFSQAVEQEKYWHTIVNEFNAAGIEIDRQILDAAAMVKRGEIEAAGGRAAWEASLAAAGMTETLYDNSLAITVYMQSLYDHYYGENGTKLDTAAQQAFFEENYVACKHILFAKTDRMTGAPLDEDALIEKLETAQDVLAQLQAGGDFEALMNEYSEDYGAMQQFPDGYILTERATSLTGFVEAAKSVEIGETTDLVETELGWSIIQRVALDPAKHVEHTDDIIQLATGSNIQSEITALMADANVEYTEAYGEPDSYEDLVAFIGTNAPAAAE